MKTYELVEDIFGGEVLKLTEESGKVWWVSQNPNNSDYAEYLRYTAWVDEGNDPDEFWNGALDG
jgi:hypothetical protein